MGSEIEMLGNGNIRIRLRMALRCHGNRKIIVPAEECGETPLLTQLARAMRWQKALDDGKFANGKCLAQTLGVDESMVSRTLRLLRLSPRIVHAIVAGDYPETLNSTSLRKNIPLDWEEQERLFLGEG